MNDLMLINGKIHTMDGMGTVVSALRIKDGKVAGTFNTAPKCEENTRVIDLKGHTVIPGLIDNHMHFIRAGLLPGHDTRKLENAFSIAGAQRIIKEEASKLPAGTLISALGGVHLTQFAEKRWPNLAELDAAAPDHPVYISQSNTGPGQVNTKAIEYFESRGIRISADGVIATAKETTDIWYKLLGMRTEDETKGQLKNNIKFAASKGLTTIFDNGGSIPDGGWLDPDTGYDPFFELVDNGEIPVRFRLFFRNLEENDDLRELLGLPGSSYSMGTIDRVLHMKGKYNNDLVKVIGIGEWVLSMKITGAIDTAPYPAYYEKAVRKIAGLGLTYGQHMITDAMQTAHLDVWEKVNADIPIAGLRWMLDHAYELSAANIERAKVMGIGICAHSTPYYGKSSRAHGDTNTPFRRILDSGIHVGGGSDGNRIGVMNPWINIYYMVTGKNCDGTLMNADQTITREEALRLWTANQGWFSREEGVLGLLVPGSFADLAVLDKDFFNPAEVSDDGIRDVESIFTIIGGKIVHDAGQLGEVVRQKSE